MIMSTTEIEGSTTCTCTCCVHWSLGDLHALNYKFNVFTETASAQIMWLTSNVYGHN